MEQLPEAIFMASSDAPISFDALFTRLANQTTARLDQIEDALVQLREMKEVEIVTAGGNLKRVGVRPSSSDLLQLPRQFILPGSAVPSKPRKK